MLAFDWRNMSNYPTYRAKQDFRGWRFATGFIAIAAAVSNLLLAIGVFVNGLVFLVYAVCSRLGGPRFEPLSITAFHTFVYGCIVLFALIGFSVILTFAQSELRKDIEKDIHLRERLYQDVVSVVG